MLLDTLSKKKKKKKKKKKTLLKKFFLLSCKTLRIGLNVRAVENFIIILQKKNGQKVPFLVISDATLFLEENKSKRLHLKAHSQV